MEIDLAKKTIGRVRKAQRAKRLLDKLIIWGALVLSLVLIVIAGLNLWANQTNQIIHNRIKSTEKQIEAKAKIESQQVYLTGKLASFGNLVKTHELHQAVAETVFALIPTGTTLKGFEVTETGVINLSGSVPNWQLLSQFLSNLRQKTPARLAIVQAVVKQVNFTGDGAISFNLELLIDVPKSDI